MTKLLYLVTSGDDAPQKFDLAINTALRMIENKRFEDIKLLFLGPSEATLAKASGERKDIINKLINLGAIDSACVAFAKNMGIEAELKLMGINQEPYGARLKYYLENGYHVVSF